MKKNLAPNRYTTCLFVKHLIAVFIFINCFNGAIAQSNVTLAPIADAYVRNGTFSSTNYGSDLSLLVKGSATAGYGRMSYLKFQLSGISNIGSAKLRIYGSNTESTATISMSVYGTSDDSWTESGITRNNVPTADATAINSVGINNVAKYYELDVTSYVITQFAGDKLASFVLRDATNQSKLLTFNSRENSANKPQLVITTTGTVPPPPANKSMLFIENLDKFPSNDNFVASRMQTPWTRDSVAPYIYNSNHDTLRIRIHNNGLDPLVVSKLTLSSTANWKFLKLKGATYNSSTSLPLSVSSGTYADLTLLFIAANLATRVKIVTDNLTIVSNDNKTPSKTIILHGLWQKQGEGTHEPTAQEIISTFGFKTITGFSSKDPDLGKNSRPKGDEVLSSYFVRADASRPVTVRQMSAYHGCCRFTETFRWHNKGSGTLMSAFTHIAKDAQSTLPRKGTPNTPAEGSFSPSGAFGFKIGNQDWSDTLKNVGRKIGIRIWKAKDVAGLIIPNTYIVSNDYLGTEFTNYDYNDNTYYVTNIRPELGPASYSALSSTPSAVDFGEKLLQSTNNFTLNLKSLGQTYSNGKSDPAITISSIAIAGDNKAEFTASMPGSTTLSPQAGTSMNITFKPVSEGLKTADLLIYYNNAASPYRVPLHGIGKASSTTVTVPFRIKSGSSTNITVNGKTWLSDKAYAFDNLEPFTNSQLTQIKGTDEDVLYLREQSSNGDKKPFRYEIPLSNGNYWLRLHFAEIFWGSAGAGLSGGAGSRVMSVTIENQLKLVNLDVAGEAGPATAIVKNIPVTVSDGKLNINFSATANRPMVCAIEVYKFSSGASISNANEPTTLQQSAPSTLSQPDKLKVYPNPAKDRLRIEFPASDEKNIRLEIFDQAGRLYKIEGSNINKGGNIIEINLLPLHLNTGIYFLSISSNKRNNDVYKLLLE